MKTILEGGVTRFFKIKYFDGGVNSNQLEEAKKVFPNEDYWMKVFGEREHEEIGWSWVQTNPEYKDYIVNYWVKKKLFWVVESLCKRLSIDIKYAHDLVVPLSDFEMANKSLIGRDIRAVANEIKGLKEFFEQLNDPFKKVVSVKFEIAELIRVDAKKGGNVYGNKAAYRLTRLGSITPFITRMYRLSKEDPVLNRFIYNSSYLDYTEYSVVKTLSSNQHQIATIIFQFLMHHNLCRTPNDGYMKTGMFLSVLDNDYLITEELYDVDEDLRIEYPKFEDYLADVMGKRISRYLKSWTEKS